MRRLGRILLNALTVLSLFLCAAAAVLWVRGNVRPEAAVSSGLTVGRFEITNGHGRVNFLQVSGLEIGDHRTTVSVPRPRSSAAGFLARFSAELSLDPREHHSVAGLQHD